jgi:hypothetical protein
MGQPVIDGGLSFNVMFAAKGDFKVEDSGAGIRDVPANMVNTFISVSNVGRSEQTYSIELQRLRDAAGREFSPHIRPADVSNNEVSLNPGLTDDAVEVDFEVPEGTSIDQYVFVAHGSPNSVGASVRLHEGKA